MRLLLVLVVSAATLGVPVAPRGATTLLPCVVVGPYSRPPLPTIYVDQCPPLA